MTSASNNNMVKSAPLNSDLSLADAIVFYGKKLCKAAARGPNTTFPIVQLPLCSVLRVQNSTKDRAKKTCTYPLKVLVQRTSCSMH